MHKEQNIKILNNSPLTDNYCSLSVSGHRPGVARDRCRPDICE